MRTMRTYQQVFQMFQNGVITQKVWFRYCQRMMFRIPELKGVLVRLKAR